MPAGLMFSTVFYVSLLFTYEGCFSNSDVIRSRLATDPTAGG
jgi:hypothetical protein